MAYYHWELSNDSKYIGERNYPNTEPLDTSGLYILQTTKSYAQITEFKIYKDDLVIYYSLIPRKGIALFFKSESDCLLWRLKHKQ